MREINVVSRVRISKNGKAVLYEKRYHGILTENGCVRLIRLCFFEGKTIEDTAEELGISAKTAQIAKKRAIEELTELFALTATVD